MSMASIVSLRYHAVKQGGPFELVEVERPTPGPTELLINIRAVALNAVDWKQLETGHAVVSWPATFGNDGAGVVEAVGTGVDGFKRGDEVLARFDPVNTASAAFQGWAQNFAVISVNNVAPKPSHMSFEEAASIPLGYMTASSALYWALEIAFPFLKNGRGAGYEPKSVLVLGGSSSVGSATIQLLRLALPNIVLISTSSPRHHAHLRSLGATTTFDYTAPDIVHQIKRTSLGGQGVEAIIDAVNGIYTRPELLETLTGPKHFAEVVTGQMAREIPADVQHTLVFGRKVMTAPGGSGIFSALGELLTNGRYKIPLPVTVLGEGLELIEPGLRKLRAGVSGTKLVVKL
ncbi:GroES-like protein [Rhizodiscina lignyota]|uniref:GroES-like protein n=1 Tax=Rhizodiscina lignyota TaxID=1504668 RepID=A0A9P4M682_9PEZI|nr:GroES-like protein [Rhizodiscina lignyota]